ncbi:GNAT family N-acetyltransferase [Frankia gtarii]|uniref:GNAT family N-acetyltransferase n=1 Tax=Frankia gtarii TaxID=2950102 RepID=UPI0021BEF909|nr:GNAT family N-acetyltransferase [Frankia gtarii]
MALGELNTSVQELHARVRPTDFHAPDAAAAASYFRDRLTAVTVLVLLAEADGQPLGYLYAEEQRLEADAFRQSANVLHVHHLCTHPDRRRSGIGRALMTTAEQHAASRALDTLLLSTGSFNIDAQRFFGALGCEPYSIRLIRRL